MLAKLPADTRVQLQELLEGREEEQPWEPPSNTFKCILKSQLRSLLCSWLCLKLSPAHHKLETERVSSSSTGMRLGAQVQFLVLALASLECLTSVTAMASVWPGAAELSRCWCSEECVLHQMPKDRLQTLRAGAHTSWASAKAEYHQTREVGAQLWWKFCTDLCDLNLRQQPPTFRWEGTNCCWIRKHIHKNSMRVSYYRYYVNTSNPLRNSSISCDLTRWIQHCPPLSKFSLICVTKL